MSKYRSLLVIICIGLFSYFSTAQLLEGNIWTISKLNLTSYPNARCLDGSAGAFWFLPGQGSGRNKFVIHHQGGGWCVDESDCFYRSTTDLGSSNTWTSADCSINADAQPCQYDGDEGLMSTDPTSNPLMFNWNKLYIGYCDGASYAGQVYEPIKMASGETIHYKGRFILDGLYDTFLSHFGMNNASDIVISGTSAGGLAVYLHADYLADKIRSMSITTTNPVNIVAVPDGGFFMDLPSITGEYLYTPIYQNVFSFQNVSGSVNENCVQYYSSLATSETWKCFFAQYTLPFIKTPLYIVNSFLDSWQESNIMGIYCDPRASTVGETICTSAEFEYFDSYRDSMIASSLQTYMNVSTVVSNGMWMCNCYVHPIVNYDHYWKDVEVEKQPLGRHFTAWYEYVTMVSVQKQQQQFTNAAARKDWFVMDGYWGSNQC